MKRLIKPVKKQYGKVSLYDKETVNKNGGTCNNTGAYTCQNTGNSGVCTNTGTGACTTNLPDPSGLE